MTDAAEDCEEKLNNVEENDELNNPYAYLEREDFTSEKFKILVSGLPKYFGIKQVKKLFNEKLGLQTCKIKPLNNKLNWIFVNFRNEEAREHGLKTIDGMVWKNCQLTAKKAKAAPDPFIKRKLEADEKNCKKLKTNDDDNDQEQKEEIISVLDQIKSTTIPLWDVPYEKQLNMKQSEMRSIIAKLGQLIARNNSELTGWIEKQRAVNDGLICELKPILSAEETNGYRNKCEFTIGKNEDNEILIGFRMSSYAAGSTTVGPIDHLCHIPERMKIAVRVFQKFVRESQLDVYDPVNHKGFWSQVTIRATRLGHLMLIIGTYPKNLPVDISFDDLVAKIINFFEEGDGKEAQVTSLYVQMMGGSYSDGGNRPQERNGPIKHLSGSLHIEESLMGLKFRISPQAFFQINSQGAEILYQAAIDLAQCDKENTSLLDICCGTGTIGLCFAKHCAEVLGIEIVGDAIKDAKENAKQNNIDNCEFFVGKAESLLKAVIQRTIKENIIAVVDPPRAGLHHQAVLSLRKTKKVSKILYVSCDPKAAMMNLVDLARPVSKQYLGEPFVPIKAIPVDMFPNTKHCELIILLERLSSTASYSPDSNTKCE